jgi:hypothetical protein
VARILGRIGQGRRNGDAWRHNVQAGDAYVGHPIAAALGLSLDQPRDRKRVAFVLRWLLDCGHLVVLERPLGGTGKRAPFVLLSQGTTP